jgi:hypothetical protein
MRPGVDIARNGDDNGKMLMKAANADSGNFCPDPVLIIKSDPDPDLKLYRYGIIFKPIFLLKYR